MDIKEITQCIYVISWLCVIYNISLSNSQEPVETTCKHGKVRGVIELVHSGKKVEKYFGIPYAKPPIGRRRFEPPEPIDPWGDNVLNAVELPPACPQSKNGLSFIENYVPGFNKTGEDCLYLNIYVPVSRNVIHRRNMPVLFFVHGGSYNTGMGGYFDGSALAIENVVVVTINYRLGPLGFLHAGDSVLPGNYGMLDQIAALKWIHENIEFFNGDPSRVTLDGQSAGGCSVGLLMMSPLTKGLFRRVIMQSGSTLAHWAVSRTRTNGLDLYSKTFASEMGCLSNSTRQVKSCLQHVDSELIENLIFHDFGVSPSLSPHFRPVVDGYFLPNTPEELVLAGDFSAESILVGSTRDEGLLAVSLMVDSICGKPPGAQRLLTFMFCFKNDLPNVPGIVDLVIDQYTEWPFHASKTNTLKIISDMVGDYYITAPTHLMAQRLSSHNTTVYVYNFEYNSVFDQSPGVIHGADMVYLSGFPLTGHGDFRFDENDKKMAKMILHLWSNFIKHGLPSLIPHKEFFIDRYTSTRPVYARILPGIQHPQIIMETGLKPKKMYFWNEQVPALRKRHSWKNSRTNCTDRYIINNPNSWALIATCIGLSVLTISFSVGYFRTRKSMNSLIRQNGLPIANRMVQV